MNPIDKLLLIYVKARWDRYNKTGTFLEHPLDAFSLFYPKRLVKARYIGENGMRVWLTEAGAESIIG